MARIENPEKYGWWLNELESFGVNTLEKNGLNNRTEASDLGSLTLVFTFIK